MLAARLPTLTDPDVVRTEGRRIDYPEARIIILATYATEQVASQAPANGAKGYLMKSSIRWELIDSIRLVHTGRNTSTAAWPRTGKTALLVTPEPSVVLAP